MLSPLAAIDPEELDQLEKEVEEKKQIEKPEKKPIFIPLWFPTIREGKQLGFNDPELKAWNKLRRDGTGWRQDASSTFYLNSRHELDSMLTRCVQMNLSTKRSNSHGMRWS